jgi:hypothetical protein
VAFGFDPSLRPFFAPNDNSSVKREAARRYAESSVHERQVVAPDQSRGETMGYTILLPSGKAWQFFYPQESSRSFRIRRRERR